MIGKIAKQLRRLAESETVVVKDGQRYVKPVEHYTEREKRNTRLLYRMFKTADARNNVKALGKSRIAAAQFAVKKLIESRERRAK